MLWAGARCWPQGCAMTSPKWPWTWQVEDIQSVFVLQDDHHSGRWILESDNPEFKSKLNILTFSFHTSEMELIKSLFIIRLLLGLNGILNIKYLTTHKKCSVSESYSYYSNTSIIKYISESSLLESPSKPFYKSHVKIMGGFFLIFFIPYFVLKQYHLQASILLIRFI